MTEISLQNLSDILSGNLKGNPDLVISELITDSRSIVSSTNSIFFALVGERNNGHKYISDLYQRGIINFVISEQNIAFDELKKANFIFVDDTMQALHRLGKYYRERFNSEVVSIIGSNGKTIVKEWLYQLLHDDINIVRSPKSYNSQLGVPLSLCLLNNKFQLAIIEAGLSKPGEMEILERIIKPDIGIITSFGSAHQENFKDMVSKAKEKLKMFKDVKTIIYSPDNKEISKIIQNEKSFHNKSVFTWSTQSKNSNLYLEKIVRYDRLSDIFVRFNEKEIKYSIPFIDEASVKNSLTCLSFLIVQNLFTEKILLRFKDLEPVEMRIEQKQAINNCILINDSYNSDIVSLKIAIDLLKNLSKNMSKTLILSDIMQSGMNDDELYKSVAGLINGNTVNRFIGIGNGISSKKNYFNSSIKTEFYKSTQDFLNEDLRKKFNNEVILLKGSRDFRFEKLSELLELKKHRTVLEINLEAITHNLNYYKSLVPNNSKIMVMVKALSYGTGTYEIANLLQHNQVDYLGVAFADEGVKLRKAGITAKIMVMNPDEDSISDIIDYQLEPEIYNFRILLAFIKRLEEYSGKKLPVHIKIDTGMNRLGFCKKEIPELIQKLKNEELIRIKSVFSHLVASEDSEHDSFTNQQIDAFKNICEQFSEAFEYSFLRHISNTSGIERFPHATFDMVRVGIGLYGFSTKHTDKLMNVSTLKTNILQIKTVLEGETVGYGRKWKATRDSKIAVIPIGYADGLSRHLSNGVGEVLIKDKKVPIVGNICMDMCMIDVTDIELNEGNEVIVFGNDYPASEISKKLNTIPYEIITGISERVKRVYIG